MKSLFIALSMLFSMSIFAQNDSVSMEEIQSWIRTDSILKSFKYQTGKITIGNNLATINVPPGCLYLNPEQSKVLMEDIYGNPPAPLSLGMLLADTPSMTSAPGWLVDYNYVEDGHVNDDDAKDIDYAELLKQIKEQTIEDNKNRISQGYESIELVGWAQAPFYDQAKKKLHWAKEYIFGGSEMHSLNYNIRVLGRQGYLEMNIISTMDQFSDVKKDVDKILNSTEFNEGQRYTDFDESTDKLAEYGIGGLIAGTVLAKTGILAKIGIFLLKIIKPLIVGVIALFGFLFKRFRKKKEEEEPASSEPETTEDTTDNNTSEETNNQP